MSTFPLPHPCLHTDLLPLLECPSDGKITLSHDVSIFLQRDSTVGTDFLTQSTDPVNSSHTESQSPPSLSIFYYGFYYGDCSPSLLVFSPPGRTSPALSTLAQGQDSRDIANNRRELRRLGITHVLNASHSRWRGTPEAYEGLGIRYLGVEAHDSPAFDMSIHFQTAADFIHRALNQPGGRILVHCAVGVSRSATLVLAYLMLYHRLTLVEAIKKVKDHRGIIPNRGFLRQLLALDRRLRQGLEA
ncbi:dual specificity protein phosphatase 26 isoform X1 [Hyaena hyaena]|uniref:dual specificity protein phosphatase 26 isoform X1 n=1 Tax=Hyaena hyaena TaxID=95912 RepID=UPI00192130F4|nr:dual specificity protein phosphatase 26 isoform X1 [Hyaena hyaena]